MTEDEMAEWHHRFNGREFEQTLGDGEGQGSPACYSSWGHKELDTTEQLNNNKKFKKELKDVASSSLPLVPGHPWKSLISISIRVAFSTEACLPGAHLEPLKEKPAYGLLCIPSQFPPAWLSLSEGSVHSWTTSSLPPGQWRAKATFLPTPIQGGYPCEHVWVPPSSGPGSCQPRPSEVYESGLSSLSTHRYLRKPPMKGLGAQTSHSSP